MLRVIRQSRCLLVVVASALVLATGRPLLAQEENPLAPTIQTDTIKPQPVCPEPENLPVCFSARTYEMLGPVLRAGGGVLFLKGRMKMTASEVEYNIDTEQGRLRDVSFTTCTNTAPDYRITAREATIGRWT